MTHYEQSRDSNGRPVVTVDGVVQENVTIAGFPYVTDQGLGLRSLLAKLEGLDDKGRPTVIRVRRDILIDVVIYHTKTNIKGCRCGWAKLGESWAEHVADVVQQRSIEEARDGD